MNVVVRGLMAAALFVYAGIHVLQGVNPPMDSPTWLRLAFLATAAAAIAIGVGLLSLPPGRTAALKDAAALLAVGSALALAMAFTVGFPGVSQMDIRADTLAVVAAELIVVASWLASRSLGSEYDEVTG